MKDISEYSHKTIKEVPLSAMMSAIYRHHAIYINNQLKEINLTNGLLTVLLSIFRNDELNSSEMTQQDIARILSMNDGTIARALRKLEDKDLIQRKPNPENRRQNFINLTKKGYKIANDFKNLDRNWEKEVFTHLTSDEIIDLKWDLHQITLNSIESNKTL